MPNRKPTIRGGSMVEFTMLIPVWLPLLVGTLWLGSSMVRDQQVTQMARDLASMYSRGTDFSSSAANQLSAQSSAILTQVTQQIGTVTPTGNTEVIFTTLTYVGKSVCASTSPPDVDANGNPSGCNNYGYFVFKQQYSQGNTSLVTSNFGVPAGPLDTSYNISLANYVALSGNRCTAFNLIPAPTEQTPNTDGYQSGQPIYIVEVYVKKTGLSGYTQGGDYAYAVF
jgi:Flp pilus assembly protein TadG